MRFSPYLCVASAGGPSFLRGQITSPPVPPPSPCPAQTQAPVSLPTAMQITDKAAPQLVTYVSLRNAFRVFICCLTQEKDWDVLQLVLREIPKVMQNKALVLSKHGASEIDLLAQALCSMVRH